MAEAPYMNEEVLGGESRDLEGARLWKTQKAVVRILAFVLRDIESQ